jgi:hypothetical protein
LELEAIIVLILQTPVVLTLYTINMQNNKTCVAATYALA